MATTSQSNSLNHFRVVTSKGNVCGTGSQLLRMNWYLTKAGGYQEQKEGLLIEDVH
jgi:hypothetical protein